MRKRAFLAGLLIMMICLTVIADHAVAADPAAAMAEMEPLLNKEPDNLQLGARYRQAAIQAAQYDRCIEFYQKLIELRPDASNVRLNFGFAYVDKIPAAGSITQVILANNALTEFTKSLEIKPSWLGYYTRGNSYLFWPRIFGRTALGIKDLEEAMKIQQAEAKRPYHVRTYVALGDGYWKMDELDKAKSVWTEGLKQFPGHAGLQARLSKQGDELTSIMDEAYDPNLRIDTSLEELWAK